MPDAPTTEELIVEAALHLARVLLQNNQIGAGTKFVLGAHKDLYRIRISRVPRAEAEKASVKNDV